MIPKVSEKITVSVVNPQMLEVIWPSAKDMVELAIEHSNKELTIDSIYDRLLIGEMLLITVLEEDKMVAALTIEKNIYPSEKEVILVTAAGGADMYLWIDKAMELVERIAKQQGCEEIYIIGRTGWAKVLKQKNFDVIHTVLSKKVGG